MKKLALIGMVLFALPLSSDEPKENNNEKVGLPEVKRKGEVSIEEAIAKRRSARKYTDEKLKLEELGQLLWAAQGITDEKSGLRAAPSACAVYPLTLYVIVGAVEKLEAGVYEYLPKEHSLKLVKKGDLREKLYEATGKQEWSLKAPVTFVFAGDVQKFVEDTRKKNEKISDLGLNVAIEDYKRVIYLEMGHSAQNVYLQCVPLGLGGVVMNAFSRAAVQKILDLRYDTLLYLMSIGRLPK
ncbi:MAG: SagB/ThcOx family dehydrogenase [Planctomycetota bacterium]|nr:SagB/ThcOx family dehydrogenase [Planctomycetota bacterium]